MLANSWSKGKANGESTSQFKEASKALGEAIASMDEQWKSENPEALESAQNNLAAASSEEQGGESTSQGDNYKMEPEAAKLWNKNESWAGLEGHLKEQGGQGQENQYDDYFTQANHRYLQKVMKESKTWK